MTASTIAPDIEQVRAELAAITADLHDAAGKINSGVTLDLSSIPARTEKLCEQLLHLPPHQAASLMGELAGTVAQLNGLSDSIKG